MVQNDQNIIHCLQYNKPQVKKKKNYNLWIYNNFIDVGFKFDFFLFNINIIFDLIIMVTVFYNII